MKKILILAVVIFSMASEITDAQIASIAAGNWSNIETWGGRSCPCSN